MVGRSTAYTITVDPIGPDDEDDDANSYPLLCSSLPQILTGLIAVDVVDVLHRYPVVVVAVVDDDGDEC